MALQSGSVRTWALPAIVLFATLVALSGAADAAQRNVRQGKEVVDAVCGACHASGKNGAPKIGDRAAWTPHMAKGLDALIDSAVHGHGPMPARGGRAELSNDEMRGAILYMFNHGLPPVPAPPATVAADPHHKLVSGTDIYLGMMRAEAMRAAQAQAGKSGAAKVDIPSGRGYYHVNISLADNQSHVTVSDAKVTMQVSDGMTIQTKALGPEAANNAVSYGNFFQFSSGNAYNIKTEIRRPGVASPLVANFEFKAP